MDILNAIIPSAIAQDAAAVAPNTGAAGFASFIPLVLMLGVFYFLLIRPQQKKMKESVSMSRKVTFTRTVLSHRS
jgi:preprotein translocase subunit YajC